VAVEGPLMHHLLYRMSASGENKKAPNLAIRSGALNLAKLSLEILFGNLIPCVSHIERFTRSGTVVLQNSVARSLFPRDHS